MSDLQPIEELSRKACGCDDCFAGIGLDLKRSTIALAQPRWVGPRYWDSSPRILALMLNPGSGDSRRDSADLRMYQALLRFRDSNSTSLVDIFGLQRADIPNWGRGRFFRFFVDSLGLDLDEIAFANIAWCATSGNQYPPRMLSHCFEKFTGSLVKLLKPSVTLLCGSSVHRFASKVSRMNSSMRVIETLHYAHREGGALEREEMHRVRAIIDSMNASAAPQ